MDPLAQLQDIQLPEPIHNYPIAIGWWLLLALFIIIFILLSFHLLKQKRINKIRNQALEQLKTTISVTHNIRLIKSTAIAYFSRHEIAALSGEKLQHYLSNKLPEKHQESFNQLTQNCFINAYEKEQGNQENIKFQQAIKLWLLKALPPKNKLSNKPKNKQGGNV